MANTTENMQYKTRKEIIANWQPENEYFWQNYGRRIAKQNLYVSTWALTLSFCVWMLWATMAAKLNSVGFNFTTGQLFTLAALPGLVGATARLFYTYMPGFVGGKNWTLFSTAILLIPIFGIGHAVQDPTTSYNTIAIIVSFIGIAGGNFSSSMANIGNFFPKKEKGTALGINAGVGNLGVSLIYLLSPILISLSIFAPIFGEGQTTKDGLVLYLQNAAYIWIIPTLLTLILIYFYMDNLNFGKQNPKTIFSIFSNKHTWIMTWIYTCGFGSFIGYSAAMALLVTKEFPEVQFAYANFLGPFIGASVRPIGGWLADKINNGAKITMYSLVFMLVGSVGVLFGIKMHNFPLFFSMFLFLFFMTGMVNGASFRMIPYIFHTPLISSLVTGFTAAIAAYGAFIIPKIFGWSYTNFNNVEPALYILFVYTAITIYLAWYYYARKNSGISC